jgi:UDP-2-acetamido-3-amino-2,3-dideoxy-glucuronate N-acetyltransferase
MGIIGLGYWGKNILRNLYGLGVLKTACDADPAVLLQWESQMPDLQFAASYQKMLSDKGIRAVAIATPAATHYAIVREALAAGKDVFVEKPLALTVEEGRTLVEMAEDSGRILMVGHILRFHPAVHALSGLIADGKLGKIRYIYSNRLNIGKLRTEENILWSFAPHDISVILALAGEEPLKVHAFGESYLSKDVYDTTLTMLEFRGGIKAHVFVSWIHPFKEQKLIVVGSSAMAVFDDVSREKLFLYPHQIRWKDGKIPVAEKADYKVIPFEAAEPLRCELEHFISCVHTRHKPVTDGREALRVLSVLERAEEALHAGQRIQAFPGTPPAKRSAVYPGVFIHESAIVDYGVRIAQGTKIWHFSHILSGSKIGSSCNIGQNVVIGPDVTIGNRCKVQNNVSVYQGVSLEDGVFCGPSMVFTNIYNPRAEISKMAQVKKTLVRKGATLGANCTIVCGNTIGRFAFIGAGAVVTKVVPDHALVVGNPGEQVGWVCKCGGRLNDSLVCQECKARYRKARGRLTAMSS